MTLIPVVYYTSNKGQQQNIPNHIIVVNETQKPGRKSTGVCNKRSQFAFVCLTLLYTCTQVYTTNAAHSPSFASLSCIPVHRRTQQTQPIHLRLPHSLVYLYTGVRNKRSQFTFVCLTLFPSQRDHPPWLIPNYTTWWQRHTGDSSLPKVITQWCPTTTRTRDL